MAEGEKRPFIKLYYDLWDDKRLSCIERVVLISLLRHYNAEKRRAWPSLDAIAEEIDRSRVVVWRNMKTLEEKGYVRTEKQVGKVTLYELPFIDTPISKINSTHFKNEPVEEQPISEFNTPHFKNERVPISKFNDTHFKNEPEQDIRTRSIGTRLKEQDKTPRARENVPAPRSAAKAFDFDAEFSAFWDAYPKPKHPDKTPGRMRYEALRRKGVSAADLLTAAKNYAVAMRGTDPQYIKRCSTFLGPSDPWRDYLNTGSATVQREDPEAAYMRDLRRAGMLTADEYGNWRRKRYEAKRV